MLPSDVSTAKIVSYCELVTSNFQCLLEEWELLKGTLKDSKKSESHFKLPPDAVVVGRETTAQLKALTTRLQRTLPAVMRIGVAAASRAALLQKEIGTAQKKTADASAECLKWKNKFAAASADCQKEKKECSSLQREVTQLSEQLAQQSEFSSALGCATATLLWRVSRNQDAISVLLAGRQVEDFLGLTCSTLQSFLAAYANDWPPAHDTEAEFVLALCGTVTNVAACAQGRDVVVNSPNGQRLLNTFLAFISKAPLVKSARTKSLMLMGLYNVSINEEGVRHLLNIPDILPLLARHLKEEADVDNRLNTLRLLQSLLAESDLTNSQQLNSMPMSLLKTLANDRNREIKGLAADLLADLKAVRTEH